MREEEPIGSIQPTKPPEFAFVQYLLVSSQTGGAADAILRYDGTSGAFINIFAQGGGLADPLGLAIGPDSNLYVASGNSNNVLRFNGITGAFLDAFASGGGLEGPGNGPCNVVFGPDKNLYISSSGAGAVLRYSEKMGIETFASVGEFAYPRGLVFGPDNNLYVVSYNDGSVSRYSGVTGAPMGPFVTPGKNGGLSTPSGLAFGPDGNLYITGSSGIYRYNGNTGGFMDIFALVGEAGVSVSPFDLVFGPDQNLYVTVQGELNGVLRFNKTTGKMDTFVANGSGGLQNPFGLVFHVELQLFDRR